MQKIFLTQLNPRDFQKADATIFPIAPKRCAFSDCMMPVKMKKHGFYRRYVISRGFYGSIYIRRYKCPCCGRTVSMLPSFLLPQFQYSILSIVNFISGYFKRKQSLRSYVKAFKSTTDMFSRRHFRFYLSRIFSNRKLIQYYLSNTAQTMIPEEDSLDSRKFAKKLLEKIHAVSPHYFTCSFFNLTHKSILAPN